VGPVRFNLNHRHDVSPRVGTSVPKRRSVRQKAVGFSFDRVVCSNENQDFHEEKAPMTIQFSCPTCNENLKAPSQAAGMKIFCPNCQNALSVPRESPRGGMVIVLVLSAIAVVMLGLTLVVYLVQRSPRPAEREIVAAPKQPDSDLGQQIKKQSTAPKGEKQAEIKLVPAKKPNASDSPPKKPVPDRTWIAAARLELLDFEKAKLARMEAYQQKLGALNEIRYQEASRLAKKIRDTVNIENAEDIYLFTQDQINRASLVDHIAVSTRLREAMMRKPEYETLVMQGRVERRFPWHVRQERYRRFAMIVGETRPWSLAVAFDDLNQNDMEDLAAMLTKAETDGFGSLSSENRRLILRAGAVRYFEKQLDAAGAR
jgi:hypothetical protein